MLGNLWLEFDEIVGYSLSVGFPLALGLMTEALFTLVRKLSMAVIGDLPDPGVLEQRSMNSASPQYQHLC